MHKIGNMVYGSILMAVHHGAVLVLGIISLYALIRWYNELNLFTYLFMAFAAVLCMIIPFFEFYMIYTVRDMSGMLVKEIKLGNKRKSVRVKAVK